MNLQEIEAYVIKTVNEKKWVFNPNKDLRSLTEEVGELNREIRRWEDGRERPDETEPHQNEIIEHIKEEIGDVFFPLVKLTHFFNLTLEECVAKHIDKMEKRYNKEKTLAEFLNVDVSLVEKVGNNFLVNDVEYAVFTAEERFEEVLNYFKYSFSTYDFSPVFLSPMIELSEEEILSDDNYRWIYETGKKVSIEGNRYLLRVVNETCGLEALVKKCIEQNGYGYYINAYDQTENDFKNLFIYRWN